MKTGRPKQPLVLVEEQLTELNAISGSRSLPHGLVVRAQIVLLAAKGKSNNDIAKHLTISKPSVGKWRARYLKSGIQGLHEELRSGRPRRISDEKVALLVRKTLNTKPKNGTQWSIRTLAAMTKGEVSYSTVNRIWHAFGLQPHRQRHFKLSTDPFFVEKVRDIVGLYLDPPDKAVVLCVDEKSQIQALDRTQPMLPMGLGYVEGVTHDYKRHGTTTLFAALDVADGKVISKCKHRHRHQEYLSFLKQVDENVPRNLDVHVVVDNYATHKHPKVKRWLATHPRWHVHYTSDLCVLAQSSRDLVQYHHAKGYPTRKLHKC